MSREVKKIILKIAKKLFKYMLENRVSFIGGKVIKGGNKLAQVKSVLKTIIDVILLVITIILIGLDLFNKEAIIKFLKRYEKADPAYIIEEIVVNPHIEIAKGLVFKGRIRDGPRSRRLAIENGPNKQSQLRIEAGVDDLFARSEKWDKNLNKLQKTFFEEYDIMMDYFSNPKKSGVKDVTIENQSHEEIVDESVNDDSITNQSHQEIVDESVNDDSIKNLSYQEIVDELNQILDANTAYLNTVNTKIHTINKIENEELSDDFDLDQLDAYLNSINLKNRTIRNGGTRGKGNNALKTAGSSKKRKRTQKRRKQRK
jgi:hypothetical protein